MKLPPGSTTISSMSNGPVIFISAAEASADQHGAKLVGALRASAPTCRLVGLGGPKMRDAGVEIWDDPTPHAAMAEGAFRRLGYFYRLIRQTTRGIIQTAPDLAIFIDSPALHLPIAKKVHRRGVKTFYYIAPQMWAWGQWRIGKLRRTIDQMACILPFEEAFFRSRGISVTYVGHPLFEEKGEEKGREPLSCPDRKARTIGLLPGSREHEIRVHLPLLLEVSRRCRQAMPEIELTLALAGKHLEPMVREMVDAAELPVRVVPDDKEPPSGVDAVITESDLCLTVSGTATLKVAAQGTAMIVVYRVNRWAWRLLGRHLVRIPYLCLVNILAGRELVPEFMPVANDPDAIAAKALEMLRDDSLRARMGESLEELVAPLIRPGASMRAARLALDLIEVNS